MKTIREWLKEGLSEEDYKRAERYAHEDWSEEKKSFKDALSGAFAWESTQERDVYWRKIRDNGGSLQTDNNEVVYTKCGTATLISSTTDPIVEAVCQDLRKRSELGIKKYGTTLKDAGLSDKELLQHAYEEALDLANYLKTLITKQNDRTN